MASGGWSAAAAAGQLQFEAAVILGHNFYTVSTAAGDRDDREVMVGNEEKIQMTNYGIFTLSQSLLAWCLVPFIVWRVPNNVSLSVSLTD